MLTMPDGDRGDALPYSVVVPAYNEQENLPELCRRVGAVMRGLGTAYELVIVDDGSTDDSFSELARLRANDPQVVGLRLSRNFGHHIALTAGLDHARGNVVILMDADLQDPPEEIPKLLAKLEEGYDVVYGVRTVYRASLFRRIGSRVFWAVLTRLSGQPIPHSQTMLRAMRAEVVCHMRRMRERSRFLAGMIAWLGFRQCGVPVAHAERYAGRSKYGLSGMIGITFHAVTSFSYVPLRVASYLGLAISSVSFAMGAYWIVRKLVYGIAVAGWASLMVAILFLGGMQLMMLGILGEYVGRILSEVQGRPLYVVAEVLGTLGGDRG